VAVFRTTFRDPARGMTDTRLILVTTSPRAEAKRIAHALIEERLAACVNLIGGVHSIYRWKETVETADEVLLLIKTQQQKVEAVRTRVHELHSYELPEFLVLDVAGGSEGYLAWIASCVQ
jgi:periplasmic divalent cation tolerance protein